MEIAAIVPIKSKSLRLPGKNFLDFNGKPLYHWIIETLSDTKLISKIYIDTDSEEVIENAPELFDVEIIERPEKNRGQTISMNDILLHDIGIIQADLYVHTHCTNPLLSSQTILSALGEYFKSDEHDSLFSVTPHHMRAFDHTGQPINHHLHEVERTQDVPVIFEENANIYIFSHSTFIQNNSRIGDTPMIFEMDQIESIEIDTRIDFEIAEYLHKKIRARDI
jgi:CMP-N-acetylneuraminic acid synthetase